MHKDEEECISDDDNYKPVCEDTPEFLINTKKPISPKHNVYFGYHVTSDKLKKKVAIKKIEPLEKNKKEIELMIKLRKTNYTVHYIASLISSPGIPSWCVVMELCQEENLYQSVKKSQFTVETRKTIALHIANGVEFLHQERVIHRDIKPQNVLFSLDGYYVKLCDFGLSKAVKDVDKPDVKSALIIGTDGWMSPESFTGPDISGRADIFSSGLLLFFVMSNGKHVCGDDPTVWTDTIKEISQQPNEDTSAVKNSGKILMASQLSLNDGRAICEQELAIHLITKMLESEPDARPPAEAVVKHALFWSIEHRLEFIQFVAENRDRIAVSKTRFLEKVDLASEWITLLQPTDSDKTDTDSDHASDIYKKAKLLSDENKNENSILVFLRLFLDIKKQPPKNLESEKDLWNYLFSRFPKIFVDIFVWFQEYIPKNLKEEFSKFNVRPKERKLIPAVNELSAQRRGKEIHITWKHEVEEVVIYRLHIFRDEKEVKVEDIPAQERKYTLENATPLHSYRFEISAGNDHDLRSKTECCEIIAKTPGKPQNIKVVLNEQKSCINVNWEVPEDDTASKYQVRVEAQKCSSKAKKCSVMKSRKLNSFKLQFPSPSTAYTFYPFGVMANGKKGEEGKSNTITIAPSAISNLRVRVESDALKLAWDKPKNELVEYRIQTYCNGEKSGDVINCSNEQFTLQEVATDNEYTFKIWAKNKCNLDGKKRKTAGYSIPPGQIQDIELKRDTQSLKLAWQKLPGNVSYCIQVISEEKQLGEATTKDPFYEFKTPIPGTQYYFKVWPRNKYGVSGKVETLGPYDIAPAEIKNLSIRLSKGAIAMSWANYESPNVKYQVKVYCKDIGSNEKELATEIETADCKCSLDDSKHSKLYWFEMWAIDLYGGTTGPISKSTEIQTAPSKVSGITLNTVDTEHMEATWDEIPDHTYTVEVVCKGVMLGPAIQTDITKYQFKAEPFKRYFVKVAAKNKADKIGDVTRSITTMLPPDIVKELKCDIDEGKMSCTWNQVAEAESYKVRIYYYNNKAKNETIFSEEIEECKVSLAVKPSMLCYCGVRAKNQCNVEGKESVASKMSPPLPVQEIQGTYENGKINFTWSSPASEVEYCIQLFQVEGESEKILQASKTIKNSSFSYDKAENSKMYALDVITQDTNGKCSNKVRRTIKTPPPKVEINSVTVFENRPAVNISWKKIEDADMKYCLKPYCAGEPSDDITTTNTEWTVEGLEPNSTYCFGVWAVNRFNLTGPEKRSTEVTTTTAATSTSTDFPSASSASHRDDQKQFSGTAATSRSTDVPSTSSASLKYDQVQFSGSAATSTSTNFRPTSSASHRDAQIQGSSKEESHQTRGFLSGLLRNWGRKRPKSHQEKKN